ncbi:MAG TPA: uroporphyrinogen decarboxylase [Thioploca sp.]|nr:uroporphyrinogen decarboxylase [Thioploca sp.]
MPPLQNDRFLRALKRQPVDMTPVWMMRQAGRYLPEYRATRTRATDFLTLCKTPELACEVTLQPLERFQLDAAILFSDILTVPDAMGLELYFAEGEGPKFKKPIRNIKQIDELPIPDPDYDLRYVMDAVSLIRHELNGKVPLIGFAGSPWTLVTYMIEGGSTKTFSKAKGMLFEQPQAMHTLLEKLAKTVTYYLNAQIAAGAQAVMIFDTWGGILTSRDYLEFSLQYMQHIVEGLTRDHEEQQVPVILFTKDGNEWLENIANTGCDAVGLDWKLPIGMARKRIGTQVALQGNMDPCILYASPDRIRQEVAGILASFGAGNGHVFNLGHGIHPQIDPENVNVFINAVHEMSKVYHQESQ